MYSILKLNDAAFALCLTVTLSDNIQFIHQTRGISLSREHVSRLLLNMLFVLVVGFVRCLKDLKDVSMIMRFF